MNKPSPRRRERRSKSPDLLAITTAIDTARALRLTVSALADYSWLAGPAGEALTACRELARQARADRRTGR
jgi:hypothetical protein